MNNEIKTEVISVDADIAAQYLKSNPKNRRVNALRVGAYQGQMKQGQWRLNGEPIIIGRDGRLLDGQHRLMAVASSGLTIPMLFVFNVEDSSFDTINTGDARTAGDVLLMGGLSNDESKTLATCIKTDFTMKAIGKPVGNSKYTRAQTPHVVAKAHEDDPRYFSAVQFILAHRSKNLPLTVGALSFLLYRFRILEGDAGKADEWMLGLMTGVNLSENDARLWIKNKIWREFAKQAKTPTRMKMGYVVKAWWWMQNNRTPKDESGLYRKPMDSFKYIALPGDRAP